MATSKNATMQRPTKRQREAFDAVLRVAEDYARELLDDNDASQRSEGKKLLNRVVIARAYINSGVAR